MTGGRVVHGLSGGHDGDVLLAVLSTIGDGDGSGGVLKWVPAKSRLKVGQSLSGFRGVPDCASREVRLATMAGISNRNRKIVLGDASTRYPPAIFPQVYTV